MYQRHRDGVVAEQSALEFLNARGLRTLQKNFRAKSGEIDLIMADDQTIVFVEVRYRKPDNPVSALESINARKQHKIRQTAAYYLLQRGLSFSADCRFDVIAIEGYMDEITWLKDAFY